MDDKLAAAILSLAHGFDSTAVYRDKAINKIEPDSQSLLSSDPITALLGGHIEQARQHPGQHSSASDSEHILLSGVKVLVVDDKQVARALIKEVLTQCGAVVITAASTKEALEILMKQKLDVTISDIGMPGKDGFQLIREVRSFPVTQEAKFPLLC